jgi:hypothetical protein
VKDFRWSNISANCLQGSYRYSAQLPFFAERQEPALRDHGDRGGRVQKVKGEFSGNRSRADGTFDVYGALAPRRTSCSTGVLEWSAARR